MQTKSISEAIKIIYALWIQDAMSKIATNVCESTTKSVGVDSIKLSVKKE